MHIGDAGSVLQWAETKSPSPQLQYNSLHHSTLPPQQYIAVLKLNRVYREEYNVCVWVLLLRDINLLKIMLC